MKKYIKILVYTVFHRNRRNFAKTNKFLIVGNTVHRKTTVGVIYKTSFLVTFSIDGFLCLILHFFN